MESYNTNLKVVASMSAFKSLRSARVLFCFHHGFGDIVHFSRIIPHLNPTNSYFITKDENAVLHVLDGNKYLTPIYGVVSSFAGYTRGRNQHSIVFSETSKEVFAKHGLTHLCALGYNETYGVYRFPEHSKARRSLTSLCGTTSMPCLMKPLPPTIEFSSAASVIDKLYSHGLLERKLCLISRNGYTSISKNWGHLYREELPPDRRREGEECRDFVKLMLNRDPDWNFLFMEDRYKSDTLHDPSLNCYSYCSIFGDKNTSAIPFGLAARTLVNEAKLSVGVPTGVFHLSMARDSLPVVGVWTTHLPTWYDEPKANSVHIIGADMRRKKEFTRPGSFLENEYLKWDHVMCSTRHIPGKLVFEAAQGLLNK